AVEPVIKAPANPIRLRVPARGEISFESVRFAYPVRPGVQVLDGVSFKVRAGEKLALVGPSGAGKSTIFHLLLRFYDTDSGTVRFVGVNLAETDPQDLRSQIALVPQDAIVFADTVAENIRFGRLAAADADIKRAADLAGASEFVARLPERFH